MFTHLLKSRRVRSQKASWLTDEIKKNINRRDFLKVFFAFSENLVFSDHKNTNLVEKFEPEVC